MNINNVYEAEIRIVLNIDYYNNDYSSKFVKKTIVYKGKYNDYYDLCTKRRYVVGSRLCAIGDMFISPESMIPIIDIIESKREKVSKGKILRKYKQHNSKGGKK